MYFALNSIVDSSAQKDMPLESLSRMLLMKFKSTAL